MSLLAGWSYSIGCPAVGAGTWKHSFTISFRVNKRTRSHGRRVARHGVSAVFLAFIGRRGSERQPAQRRSARLIQRLVVLYFLDVYNGFICCSKLTKL
jgi:hypothetical protein